MSGGTQGFSPGAGPTGEPTVEAGSGQLDISSQAPGLGGLGWTGLSPRVAVTLQTTVGKMIQFFQTFFLVQSLEDLLFLRDMEHDS